jgi:hypothetical protein
MMRDLFILVQAAKNGNFGKYHFADVLSIPMILGILNQH